MIAERLKAYGVRRAVVSPGARNASLLQSLSDNGLMLTPIVDERVAAFIALGMGAESGEPIALVCTSGTALLNYAPALAEALYRRVPLLAISADRPAERIDRLDSQTLRQPGALDAVVKHSVALPAASGADAEHFSARLIDDAIIAATTFPEGPVHINVPIDFTNDPAAPSTSIPTIRLVGPDMTISTVRARQLGRELASPKKVLIAVGGGRPSPKLNKALAKLASMPNIVVATEPTANVASPLFIPSPEAALIGVSGLPRLHPDIVITLGAPLTSARLKTLCSVGDTRHWVVGGMTNGTVPDTFGKLDTIINLPPETFMPLLASAVQPHRAPSDYADAWRIASDRGTALYQSATSGAEWSTLRASRFIFTAIPKRWNVQVSNGMSIRLACLAATLRHPCHRMDCNRGVSGIDGSTSTAIGASLSYTADATLLITGDMSALYDLGALASGALTPRMKIIVLDNGGGGIFSFSSATRTLPCRSELLSMDGLDIPIGGLARSLRFAYFEASSEDVLYHHWAEFVAIADRPAILRVVTNGARDAQIFNDYYHNSSSK